MPFLPCQSVYALLPSGSFIAGTVRTCYYNDSQECYTVVISRFGVPDVSVNAEWCKAV